MKEQGMTTHGTPDNPGKNLRGVRALALSPFLGGRLLRQLSSTIYVPPTFGDGGTKYNIKKEGMKIGRGYCCREVAKEFTA